MRILVGLVIGVLVCGPAKASTWSQWNCDVQPRTAEEAKFLKESPHGAYRYGKYELRVKWAGGVHVFKDKPPYGDELGNSWFAYCGFHANEGWHMIMMTNGDTFTGELLDDRTGKILPAGENVWTSPDGNFYAATEQPDGQDGETAMLYKRDGTLLWKGYSGMLAADGSTVVVEFDTLAFYGPNQLVGVVKATAEAAKREFVLKKQADGSWKWLLVTEGLPAPVR